MGHDSIRRSYDAVAENYLAGFGDELADKPLDRALLTALAEQCEPGVPIADLGCGPGHVAAWLAGRGATTVGIDLSESMVAAGRREFPEVEFRQGDLLELPAKDQEFGAVAALYSIIHLRPGELRPAFEEMHRVLRPGGRVLVSFHVGTEVRHLDDWFGRPVDVDFRFYEVGDVVAELTAAGFGVDARLERRHHPQEVETLRAYVLGTRGEPA